MKKYLPRIAAAGVIVDPVYALAPVEARGAGALVHVHLTVGACETSTTLAHVPVHL
jgi:hypothetical protein